MDGGAAQLHLFSDASEFTYSACAYLRIVDKDGSTHCSFVMGKCRNVPLKRPTIGTDGRFYGSPSLQHGEG